MPKSYEQNPMEDTLLWDEQVAASARSDCATHPDPAAQDPC